jgi:hypothetical protein
VDAPIPRIMQMTGHKTVPQQLQYNVAAKDDFDLNRDRYDGAPPKR